MSSLELRSLQLIELKILNKFIEICEKNSLRYYLIGGSCLGAVRHKGFIPWDDDIDVGMPRSDYLIFLDIAQKELGDSLFLQTYETDAEYIYNFAKIRNSNTTFLQTPLKELRINHGVYIDIFPLDGVSNNALERKYNRFRLRCLFSGIDNYYLKNKTNKKWRSIIVGFIMKKLYKPNELLLLGDTIAKKYDYETSDLVVNYFGRWGDKELVPRRYFGNGCVLEFENIFVKAPIEYHKYLTNVYGDYMTPPSKDNQVSGHETSIIDLKRSYTFYIEKT